MGLELELGPIPGGGVVRPSHQAPDLVPEPAQLDRVVRPGVGVAGGGERVVGIGRVGGAGLERELLAATADLRRPADGRGSCSAP